MEQDPRRILADQHHGVGARQGGGNGFTQRPRRDHPSIAEPVIPIDDQQGQVFKNGGILKTVIHDNYLAPDRRFQSAGGAVGGGGPILDIDSTVGCVPFQLTAISPNDCLPFPDLQTQSGDKLIGVACSLCTIEVFWADNDPGNQDDEAGDPH